MGADLAIGTSAQLAVIGAGVSGSVTALCAARSGRRVVLIHGPVRRRPELGETLPPEATRHLVELGLMEVFGSLHSRPCRANRSAWGSDQLRTWEHLRSPHGGGWHIERGRLEAVLRAAAVAAGAHPQPGAVRRIENTGAGQGFRLRLDGADGAHHLVEATHLVDATGRSAQVARHFGACRVQHDHLVGLVVHCAVPDADPATLVEAVPTGWWYSAPTATGLVAILFSDADLVDWRRARHSHGWRDLLEYAPHTRARVASGGTVPILVAASTSIIDSLHGPRWLAVGDAAASHHPLGSSGVLHGLVTGRTAAGAIGADIDGDPSAMVAYTDTERESFHDHLRQRGAYYRVERRWPDAPFWRRRADGHGRGVDLARRPERAGAIGR
ncbi:MAG: tryptophan 7-halogenase [Pseudonocardia sp.]